MIPGWKVRRELTRFGQQLRAIPEAIWEPFAQRRHDAAFARGFPLRDGQVALTEKIALVLIWQPRGIAQSTIDMCAHLAAQGYAPFVLSNAALTEDCHARLAPHVWRVMQRPNFGYDFGGYRDGLLQLRAWGIQPARLVILNDSIWFPLTEGCTLLHRMEATPGDVIGTVLRLRGEEQFLESYFFSIPASTLTHPAFDGFWRDLRLTSNKYKVIRRGERGFGRAMRAAGLTLTGLFGQDVFLHRIGAADDDLLRATLRHAAFVDPDLAARARRLASDTGPDWRAQALGFVASSLQSGLFYSSYPVAAVRLMGYPVLKKSREPVSLVWRKAYLEAVETGALPAPPVAILQEAITRF
ncbi:MAG: rhamnan synthesis F family protein [Pseudomonadota bacterium]